MKLLTFIGTRPEAIKMAPVLHALRPRRDVTSLLALTGQHRELIDAPLEFFGVPADYRLDLGDRDQDPLAFVERTVPELVRLLEIVRPDRVVVQGDTASAMAGAEAARQCALPLAHVEAGLRTHCELPWPEEPFRRAIDAMSDLLLAPTDLAAANLRNEGLPGAIHITGNSGVDALHWVVDRLARNQALRRRCEAMVPTDRPFILVTLHRRENIGQGTEALCAALQEIARALEIVLPLHPNPRFAEPIRRALANRDGIHLLAPQSPPAMVMLMQRSRLIMTDSGGIQEEAPSLGKPALVLRDATERPEGIATGIATLVPLETDAIVAAVRTEPGRAKDWPIASNPYGDGRAARRIAALP